MESEKEAVAPCKLLCIPLFTHSSEILPGRLNVQGVQVVIKGKKGGRCYTEATDTLWRPSQVPRAALHLNGGQKMMPTVGQVFDVLWFCFWWRTKMRALVLVCFCVCGRKQTTNKTIREQPQHERGHLTIELT